MNFFKCMAASAAVVFSAAAADAAVLDFDIGGADPGNVDGIAQTIDGVDVTITSNTGCAYWDTSPATGGMGAYDSERCSGNDNLEMFEILTFTFVEAQKLLGFTLNGNHTEFGDGSIDVNGETVAVTDGAGTPSDNGFSNIWIFSSISGGSSPDTGYLSSITVVSQVPIPAAGFLLLGGLGGLAAMKRRKKAA